MMPVAENPVREARSRRGYSLVEVLVAMAIMGTVIIAIMSLFFLGQRNVFSGKQMTKAITMGNRVLEDLAPLTKQDIYNGAFAITDTSTGGSVSLGGITYTNAKIRSTNATLIASPPSDIQAEKVGGPGFIAKWTSQIASLSPDLKQGSVTLIMQPQKDPLHAVGSEQFASSQVLRLRVLVQWQEAKRLRSLALDSVKVY